MTVNIPFSEVIEYFTGIKALLEDQHLLLLQIKQGVTQLSMDEQAVKDLLTKIDANTNKNADAVATCSTVVGTIKTELESWIAKAGQTGVSQALIDQAQALANKSDAVTSTLDAVVASLQSVAAEGQETAGNPPPPPPPTL